MIDLEDLVRRVVREELAARDRDLKPSNDFLDTKTAAQVAAVAVGTIRRWCDEGKLTKYYASRRVRVARAELEQLLRTPRRAAHVGTDDASIARLVSERMRRAG